MINSEMLWTGPTGLRPANGTARPGRTDRRRLEGTPDSAIRRRRTATEATAGGEAITVYLLDDHELVRRGLRDLLEGEGDIEVIGESGSPTTRGASPRCVRTSPCSTAGCLTARDRRVP